MLLFYGSQFELHDLPLPRLPHEQWALIHEESPKNNWAFCNDKFMSLFNYTATFRRNSDYPVTLQWLTSIEVSNEFNILQVCYSPSFLVEFAKCSALCF